MVSAAYLRTLGATQLEAAKAVGRSARTIRHWERDPTWPAALAEARDRWLGDLRDAARLRLLSALRKGGDGDGRLALSVLERLEPDLAPATQRYALRVAAVERLAALPPEKLRELEDAPDDEILAFLEGGSGG